MEKKRSSFTGRIGFVLAAAGSAVGLGNLWRFPYLAAKYGGGIFILVYLILAVTFGFSLMITEVAIGRKTGLSCIGAYRTLDKRFGFLGWLASVVPVLIVPYYCVIGGWVVKYFWEFLNAHGSEIAAQSGDYFNAFISVSESGLSGNPMLWFIIFTLLTAVVVIGGVQKGIEKVSKILMPILVVLSVVISVFVLTIPNAMAGIKYYLVPDFSNFSVTTVLAAVGQLFYSMSLAMGIMITYGSYMKKDSGLEKAVSQIEIFDVAIALLAGFMIIPSVVAFNGGSAEGINAGPGLMFVTLPQVFNAMKFGQIIGTAFFLLVLFAALTSAISLMETVVSILMDKLHWKRLPSCAAVFVLILALGSLSCMGYGPLASVQVIGMAFLD
ncbi:MAG: sodium-dependent transporter, partial [Butyricicoccaceae bacterium]